MQIDWNVDDIYLAALAHAKTEDREVDIKDFWFLADDRWMGPAPRDVSGLEHRAWEYHTLDKSIAKYAVNRDEMNVAASIKRVENARRAKEAGLITPEPNSFLTWASRGNLMFLAREVFDKFFTFEAHAQICNLFVQKDQTKAIRDQDRMKRRLLLYGRGTGKSTLDMIDCVQWIINFPNVRIMVVTGVVELAIAFVAETKDYFIVDEDLEPTAFQRLFPKFCIPADKRGRMTWLICPARDKSIDKKRGATLWASSILKASTGQHCDIIKGDDTVHEKNVETPPLIEKVVKKLEKIENILNVGGFVDWIGTPYAGNDAYARALIYAKEHPELQMVLRVPSLIRRPESIYKEEGECTEVDFFVTFPKDKYGNPMLTFEHLWELRSRKPEDFKSQQMLDPSGIKKITFTLELLHRQTIDEEVVPGTLIHYLFVDTANTDKSYSDYTVAFIVGVDYEGRMFVLDVYRGKDDNGSEKSKAIAELIFKYSPKVVFVEDANGAKYLEKPIREEALALGVQQIVFNWVTPDRTRGAKAARVFSVEPYLTNGKLFFARSLTCLSDLYDEFVNFGSAIHDDIPDTLGGVVHTLGLMPTAPMPPEEVARIEAVRRKEDAYKFGGDVEDEVWRQQMDEVGVQPEIPIPEPEIPQADLDEDVIDYFSIPGQKKF